MLEQEYEFDLRTAKTDIRNWKTRFFRKNSKHPAKICARCFHAPEHMCFWKYFLEITVNGKIVEQYRIQKVVYDTFDYDKSLRRIYYTGIEIIVLDEFNPSLSGLSGKGLDIQITVLDEFNPSGKEAVKK